MRALRQELRQAGDAGAFGGHEAGLRAAEAPASQACVPTRVDRRQMSVCALAMLLPVTAFSRGMVDLKSLRIPGVQAFVYRDESTLPLNQATTELAHAFKSRGASRGVDGETLAADASTSDAAIAKAIDGLLGSDWQRRTGFVASNAKVHLMVWERQAAPKRFYAIAAYQDVHTATDGRKYRPLESVFTRER